MNPYQETKENYEKGVTWHIQKSLTYHWEKQITTFVKELKGKKILDAGCGGGRDIQEFVNRGFTVDGIDYSHKTITQCKKAVQILSPRVRLYVRDIRETKLSSAQYDGVWACASLLHLQKQDIPLALREWKRLLKKDGVLFVSVKEGQGEVMLPDKIGKRFFSFFAIDEIKNLVKAEGFTVFQVERIEDAMLTGKNTGATVWICVFAKKL